MKNSNQLKALIRNYSKESNVSVQILLRNYVHERFIERVSLSKYKNNIVFKGGQLISVLVGLESRSTMDMDATIKGLVVDKNYIAGIIEEILAVKIDDNVRMKLNDVHDIRPETDGGYRVAIDTVFDGIFHKIKIDITVGDVITPLELRYEIKLMFEGRKIAITKGAKKKTERNVRLSSRAGTDPYNGPGSVETLIEPGAGKRRTAGERV